MEICLHNENTGVMVATKVLNCNVNGMVCDLMSGIRTTYDKREFKVYVLNCNLLGVSLDIELDADNSEFRDIPVSIDLVRKIFDSAMDSSLVVRLMEGAYENGIKLGEKSIKQQLRNILEI